MPSFDLPTRNLQANPEFRDAESCAAWLQDLPLINVGPSHRRLLDQLEELNGFELRPGERLKIAELLREPVSFVQVEHAKKYSNRPAPLAPVEREVFRSVVALWQALAHCYEHCLTAAADAAHGALASQRALWCVSQKIQEHYKIYCDVPAGDWKSLHQIYAVAEERDVADEEVAHPVYKGKVETTCAETYARALLLDLANPNERPPRQAGFVLRWLERWSRKVEITRTAPVDDAPTLSVDLTGDKGAARGAAAAGENVRYLELQAVAKSLRKRVKLLRRGESPASLGLGEEVTAAIAEQLLITLHRLWCEDKQQPRAHPRRSASGTALVCSGLSGIQHYVSGGRFRQPGEAKPQSQSLHEDIATFGRVTTRREEEDYSDLHGFMLETWQIKDESIAGLRLDRPDPAAVGRYQLQQLIAARPTDGKSFILGTVRWLSVSQNFELRLGLRTLPGVPQAIAVRSTGLNATAEKYVAALLLPASPMLQSPDRLILPPGWYRPGRVVEIYRDNARNVTLSSLLEHGSDFDCVAFNTDQTQPPS
jgi:hypothetical protein